MKITAKEVLDNRNYRCKMLDPLDCGCVNRITRLAEIKSNVLDFVYDVLSEFELPSAPDISVGNIRGFETPKPVKEIKGYIVVNASLNSLSGRTLRMALPIPIYKGEFLRPSMMVVNSKRMVFSQSSIDKLIEGLETDRPAVEYPYSAYPAYQHEEVVGRGEFASFPDPVNWDDVILDWGGLSKGS